MHETTRRLIDAVHELQKLKGPADATSEVALAIGVTIQTLTNWELRGVSKSGVLNASKKFGLSATWIETGDEPKFTAALLPSLPAGSREGGSSRPTVAEALPVVLDAIASSSHRAELRLILPLLVDTNASAYRQRLHDLLTGIAPEAKDSAAA